MNVFKKFCVLIDKTLIASLISRFLPFNLPDDLIVIAHRGGKSEMPENTLAAFKNAINIGVNGIECDIIFTSDNIPVVTHHNDVLNIVSQGQRPATINTMNWSEVKNLNIKGQKISTLGEVLRFLKGKVARIYLHDKKENVRENLSKEKERINVFAREIINCGAQKSTVVMVESGDISVWRQLAPDISLLQCWSGAPHQKDRIPIESSISSGVKNIGIYHDREQLHFVGRMLSKFGFYHLGLTVGFWPKRKDIERYLNSGYEFSVFTINDELAMKLYINAGIKAIGTDYPFLLLSILRTKL